MIQNIIDEFAEFVISEQKLYRQDKAERVIENEVARIHEKEKRNISVKRGNFPKRGL